MSKVRYRDDPSPSLVQTGDLIEGLQDKMRGHYLDTTTPEICPCCHLKHYYANGFMMVLGNHGFEAHVCAYARDWHQDEVGKVACDYHLLEKIKDKEIGAFSGAHTVPTHGNFAYKRPDERAVTPIVHK